jgi:hypothetical protein
VTSITSSTAKLTATRSGQAGSESFFQWRRKGSADAWTGWTVSHQQCGPAANEPVSVTASGLQPNSTYIWQFCTRPAGGTYVCPNGSHFTTAR